MPKAETKFGGTPFFEAIDFFKSKVRLPTATWTDIWQGEHSKAFVVAGAMKDDLLLDFQTAMMKAREQGTTLAEFRKDFDAIVAKHGWSFNGSAGWRSRVIYNTNMRQSAMAGKWQQAQRLKKSRPYLRYVARQGGNRRPEHQALHGLILPVDHPFWRTHYPMNGWGCQCTVQSLSEDDLKRYGYTVSEKAPHIEYEERTINTAAGKKTIKVPKGIAPGFDYNPGEAGYGRQIEDYAAQAKELKMSGKGRWETVSKGDWKSEGRPEELPLDKPVSKIGESLDSKDDIVKALKKIIGGDEKIYKLADGSAVKVISEKLGQHLPVNRTPYLPFLPELLENPAEIWVAFERDKINGKFALRKRLVKVLEYRNGRGLALVANAEGGEMLGWTFIPLRRAKDTRPFRVGKLVWFRGE